jgi:multidrug efflux pump subunit AcrA (membrane-fusion protein)
VKDERAVEVPVAMGQRLGSVIEVKDGLKEGEKVIARIDDSIHNGSKVSVAGK